MRGRRNPTANQISEGDPCKIGKHKLIEKLNAEPRASVGLPECPKTLTGRARYAWELWAPELAVMELDRQPDAVVLEGACLAYGRAAAADRVLAREGILIRKKNGEVRKHPAVDISDREWRRVKVFCCEFGFTPASRTRLTVEKRDASAQDLMAVLSQPRQKRSTSERAVN